MLVNEDEDSDDDEEDDTFGGSSKKKETQDDDPVASESDSIPCVKNLARQETLEEYFYIAPKAVQLQTDLFHC